MNEYIKISLVKYNEGFAYDVEIKDENATLWQYIEALDAFLDEKVAPCLGCDNCCYQRIPLTLPDIYSYAGKEKEDIAAFLRERAVIEKKGRALDIRLQQKDEDACTFLDTEEQRCLNHKTRSLVCHTYICIPQTERSLTLREFLINEGEDALLGELHSLGLLGKYAALGESYPQKPHWQGKSYKEILLKDVVNPTLWEVLTKPLS